MTDVVEDQLVADLSRQIVSTLAPNELPLYGAISQAWFADPKRTRSGGGDDVLGFGAEEVATLLTPIILSAASNVLGRIIGELTRDLANASAEYIRQQLRKLFRGDATAVSLSAGQLAEVRETTVKSIRRFRLPEAKARQIADAMVSHLASKSP